MVDDDERLPDLDPELRALVSAYETATARDEVQIDAALARVTANAGPAGSGGAAAMSTTTKLGIVGGLAGVVAVVGIVALGPSGEPAAPRPISTPAASVAAEPTAPPVVVETPPAGVDTPSATASGGADPVVVERERGDRRAKASGASRPPRSTEPPVESSLKAELELLRQARSALRRGRAEEALEIVHAHRREYPRSAIAEERDATEVSALCALGRLDEEACR